jgi:hypothetical protein
MKKDAVFLIHVFACSLRFRSQVRDANIDKCKFRTLHTVKKLYKTTSLTTCNAEMISFENKDLYT